jgi:hypothetical protein
VAGAKIVDQRAETGYPRQRWRFGSTCRRRATYLPAAKINQLVFDQRTRERLVTMTAQRLWIDLAVPNRERKRLLARIAEGATLIKFPAEGITKLHVRFRGGKTETLTTLPPKSSPHPNPFPAARGEGALRTGSGDLVPKARSNNSVPSPRRQPGRGTG